MREAVVERKTKETDIKCRINLDGKGVSNIDTGIGFFDHMLTAVSKHGFMDIDLTCKGDLEVDSHHTIEDCGIVLGEAFKKALGDMKGITRYGNFLMPMDEALIMCAVDIGGRACFVDDITFTVDKIGEMDTEMVHEFFFAFANNAKINLHLREITGVNNHHVSEGCFKAFAKALSQAVNHDPRVEGVLSTKGVL